MTILSTHPVLIIIGFVLASILSIWFLDHILRRFSRRLWYKDYDALANFFFINSHIIAVLVVLACNAVIAYSM